MIKNMKAIKKYCERRYNGGQDGGCYTCVLRQYLDCEYGTHAPKEWYFED